MIFLTLSKISKEVAEIRRKTVEETEELMEDKKGFFFFQRILHGLSSSFVITSLALLGLFAAAMEVRENLEIGSHHGAIFLALHDIVELVNESHITTAFIGNTGAVVKEFFHNPVLKLTLAVGAMVTSVLGSFTGVFSSNKTTRKVGIHVGVLLVSTMKTLAILGTLRTDYKEKQE